MNESKKIDKRSKEYKEWKKNHEAQSEGLGDTVAKITKATGIDKVVKFIAGEDCGCDERKDKLNEIFRYNKPECLTEDEFNYLADFFSQKTKTIRPSQQKRLLEIYNRVLRTNKQPSTCAECWVDTINELKKVYETYL
jgi:predicted Zn-ribbon and HTH transcriptional regulator